MYCQKCGEHFTTYYEYHNHVTSNPLHLVFQCLKCQKGANGWKDLKMHYQFIHNLTKFKHPQTYFCTFCGCKENTLHDINQHISEKHSDDWLLCPLCLDTFLQPERLFAHIQNMHQVINNVDLVCKECQKHFFDPSCYTLHMSQLHHSNLITYQCVVCPNKVNEESRFITHVHQHAPKRLKNQTKQCFVCAEIESDLECLNIHFSTTHFANNKCTLCKGERVADMLGHLRDVHQFVMKRKGYPGFQLAVQKPKCKARICKVCNVMVSTKKFGRHTRKHDKCDSKPIHSLATTVDSERKNSQNKGVDNPWKQGVSKNNKNFLANQQLSQSSLFSNTNAPSLKCTDCDRYYDTVENLLNHVKAQHYMVPFVTYPIQTELGGQMGLRLGGFQLPQSQRSLSGSTVTVWQQPQEF